MQTIHTALTALLGIDAPIVVPPMTFACGGELAARVTLAGGYGLAAGGIYDGAEFARELNTAREILSTPPNEPLKIGAGFLGWMLDAGGKPVDTLHVALKQRVRSIWLAFGNDLGKWVEYIRRYDLNRTQSHSTLIWILVSSVAEAQVATKEWKADVLVVQGIEAGGHGHSQALPLMTILPLIRQSLSDSPPLVAAGGVVNGGQVAAMLTLGASGAVLGTRFMVTPESQYSSNRKKAAVAATSSVRSFVFDKINGSLAWPAGVDGRGLHNKMLDDYEDGVDIEEQKKRLSEAMKADDASRMIVWSGASVALINDIRGAEALTRDIHEEIVAHLGQASAIISGK